MERNMTLEQVRAEISYLVQYPNNTNSDHMRKLLYAIDIHLAPREVTIPATPYTAQKVLELRNRLDDRIRNDEYAIALAVAMLDEFRELLLHAEQSPAREVSDEDVERAKAVYRASAERDNCPFPVLIAGLRDVIQADRQRGGGVSTMECLSELMRGLEIPPGAITNVKPHGFYAIGAAIAAQAKQAAQRGQGRKGLDFTEALKIANSVLDAYKIDQPKWLRRMDGTPILNDLAALMAMAFKAAAPDAHADGQL